MRSTLTLMGRPALYADFGVDFEHVPPAVMHFLEWQLTPLEMREDDEKSASAWCAKYDHSKDWAVKLQNEPEYRRLFDSRCDGMGFTMAHYQTVWANYYRQAATGPDSRATRNFLIDMRQIVPDAPIADEADGAPSPEELKARHRDLVLAELNPAPPPPDEPKDDQ